MSEAPKKVVVVKRKAVEPKPVEKVAKSLTPRQVRKAELSAQGLRFVSFCVSDDLFARWVKKVEQEGHGKPNDAFVAMIKREVGES